MKPLSFLIKESEDNLALILASKEDNNTAIILTSDLTFNGLHAGNIVKTITKDTEASGGGQASFATISGLKTKEFNVQQLLQILDPLPETSSSHFEGK